MRAIILGVALILSQFSYAQSFTEIFPTNQFQPVVKGASAFADIDGDGDEDVVITGNIGESQFSRRAIALLYKNVNGRFVEVENTPFVGVYHSAVAFSDMDNDGDQDLLISGIEADSSFFRITKQYLNDGFGNFTEVNNAPFENISHGRINFSDVDGDGDDDVLMLGLNRDQDQIAKLYMNDGGDFTEVMDAPFQGLSLASVVFGDVDLDGDEDVLISGRYYNSSPYLRYATTKLYINNGVGIFAASVDSQFVDVFEGSVAFSDVDLDGDLDALIIGTNNDNVTTSSKLYLNDGFGHFEELMTSVFQGVGDGDGTFIDVDGDGDEEVLITGSGYDGFPSTKLYINDDGVYTEDENNCFDVVTSSTALFSDVNGDGFEDVLIIGGEHRASKLSAYLYMNDGLGNLGNEVEIPTIGLRSPLVGLADFNSDGYPDILLKGQYGGNGKTAMYVNDGNGFFTTSGCSPFHGFTYGASMALADVNNDSHMDVFLTGYGTNSKLYMNDGLGGFYEHMGPNILGVEDGAVAFSDVNNDGHVDLLITGFKSFYRVANLYINDGFGNFHLKPSPFVGVHYSALAFSDIDGDGDDDVLITGDNPLFNPSSMLYRNDGHGNFTEITNTPFVGIRYGSVAFADIDNDGDNDLLMTGSKGTGGGSPYRISKLYANDGLGNFTEIAGTPFEPVSIFSAVVFEDIDNDDDQDVLIAGGTADEVISKLYINDGNGSFTELIGVPFEGVTHASVALTDINNDQRIDVVISGSGSNGFITKFYLNDGQSNTKDKENDRINSEVILFPNPTASDKLFLKINSKYELDLNVSIYDIQGRLIRQRRNRIITGINELFIDISALSKGSYTIHFDYGDEKASKTFIVH